jgi:hypothetical protein
VPNHIMQGIQTRSIFCILRVWSKTIILENIVWRLNT